jgi:hypothetical protein
MLLLSAENALDELGRENIQAFYEAEFAREAGGEVLAAGGA